MWHGVLCYLFVDLPPPNPSPLFSTETPPRFTECHLRFSENTAKFCSSKALLGQKKHVKSFSFTAAFSPFYKVNWPSHYLSWSGSTLPAGDMWSVDGLLAQPLSCLRQRLSLPCRVQVVARNVRGRSTPASLLTGESNIAGLFFSTPFSFLFFCFFNLYPVFIFLMMLCCKPEKEKDGERLNHQCQERKKQM